MKFINALVALGILMQLSGIAAAQAAQISVSCSKIADASARLACFDRAFPNPDGARVGAAQPSSALQTQPLGAPNSRQSIEAAEAAKADNAGKRTGSPFEKREAVDISSRIKSVRDKDKQKMVFLLENDQIWLQESPRSLPFDEGDDIQVKSAKLGGYMLSNSKGVSTRVRRIK